MNPHHILPKRIAALKETFAEAESFSIIDVSPNEHGAATVKADGTIYNVQFMSDNSATADVVAAVHDL